MQESPIFPGIGNVHFCWPLWKENKYTHKRQCLLIHLHQTPGPPRVYAFMHDPRTAASFCFEVESSQHPGTPCLEASGGRGTNLNPVVLVLHGTGLQRLRLKWKSISDDGNTSENRKSLTLGSHWDDFLLVLDGDFDLIGSWGYTAPFQTRSCPFVTGCFNCYGTAVTSHLSSERSGASQCDTLKRE